MAENYVDNIILDFTKEDIRRLEAFEMWIWRFMMKVSWTEHRTNERGIADG